MPWDVVDLKIIAPLALLVSFSDGTSGEVRFQTSHLTGVFSALKDFNFFKQAFIDRGAVAWPDNIDLAPDAMYNAIKANGVWVLR
jgi:hypothetical protein